MPNLRKYLLTSSVSSTEQDKQTVTPSSGFDGFGEKQHHHQDSTSVQLISDAAKEEHTVYSPVFHTPNAEKSNYTTEDHSKHEKMI